MTRLLCSLLLNTTTLRLSYTSIKCLRSSNHDPTILKLWSIIAFHTLYTFTGIEKILALVPFFYSLKFLALIFILLNLDGVFGYLVNGIDLFHETLDDVLVWMKALPRKVIMRIWRLPRRVFYDIFCSGREDWDRVRELRRNQLAEARRRDPFVDYAKEEMHQNNLPKSDSFSDIQEALPVQDTSTKKSRKEFPLSESKDENTIRQRRKSRQATSPQKKTKESPRTPSPSNLKHRREPVNSSMEKENKTPKFLRRSPSSFASPIAQSRLHASSLHLRKFSQSQRTLNSDDDHSVKSQLKTLLVGDSHIRFRDYLFDLDLPPPVIASPLNTRFIQSAKKVKKPEDLASQRDKIRRRRTEGINLHRERMSKAKSKVDEKADIKERLERMRDRVKDRKDQEKGKLRRVQTEKKTTKVVDKSITKKCLERARQMKESKDQVSGAPRGVQSVTRTVARKSSKGPIDKKEDPEMRRSSRLQAKTMFI